MIYTKVNMLTQKYTRGIPRQHHTELLVVDFLKDSGKGRKLKNNGKLIRPTNHKYVVNRKDKQSGFLEFCDTVRSKQNCDWEFCNGSYMFEYFKKSDIISIDPLAGFDEFSFDESDNESENGRDMRQIWDSLLFSGFRPSMDYFNIAGGTMTIEDFE